MTQKHTPAPWRRGITLVTNQTERWSKDQWKKNDEIEMSHIFSNFKMDDEGKSRQLVATINRDHPDYEANAILISAAPELLEALEKFNNSFNEFNPNNKQSRMNMRLAVIAARAAIAKAKGEI